jgi:hypothetical protein
MLSPWVFAVRYLLLHPLHDAGERGLKIPYILPRPVKVVRSLIEGSPPSFAHVPASGERGMGLVAFPSEFLAKMSCAVPLHLVAVPLPLGLGEACRKSSPQRAIPVKFVN